MEVAKATLLVHWHGRAPEPIAVQYNPTELSYDKGVQIAEIAIPGLDSPLQQFIRGNSEKLTMELFFDTTDHGMGSKARSVTTKTDKIYQLVKIEPTRHAPPICTFVWNDQFPGSSLGTSAGSQPADALGADAVEALNSAAESMGMPVAAVAAAAGVSMGNQTRNGFQCVVESVKQKFTLFSSQGIPLRATLSVTLREYKTLEQQLQQLNRTSPDRTHSHIVQQGDTLSRLAAKYYMRPGEWRPIAEANEIEDPRRLPIGTFLTIPPTR